MSLPKKKKKRKEENFKYQCGSNYAYCLNSELATVRTTIGSKKDGVVYGFNCFKDHQFYFKFSTRACEFRFCALICLQDHNVKKVSCFNVGGRWFFPWFYVRMEIMNMQLEEFPSPWFCSFYFYFVIFIVNPTCIFNL